MNKKNFWTVQEIIEFFEIDESFLLNLEKEEIICPEFHEKDQAKLFQECEVEKLRLAKILVEDMDVNLAGVEVILRMKLTMIEMRNQFDHILEDLVAHFQQNLKQG